MGLFGGIARAFESDDTKKARQMLATRPIFQGFRTSEKLTVASLLGYAKRKSADHLDASQKHNQDIRAKRRPYTPDSLKDMFQESCLSMLYGVAAKDELQSYDAAMRQGFVAPFRDLFGGQPDPAPHFFEAFRLIPAHPLLDHYVPCVRTGEIYIQACRARADAVDAQAAQAKAMRAAISGAKEIILEYRFFHELHQTQTARTAQQAYEAAMSCSLPSFNVTGIAVSSSGAKIQIFKISLDVLGSQSQDFFNGWTPDSKIQEYNHFDELERQRRMGL